MLRSSTRPLDQRRVRRDDDVGEVVERRVRRQRLVAECVQDGAADAALGRARSRARSSTRRPRATLMSQAPGFIAAKAASSKRSSVSGVRGSARTTKSVAASSSGSALGWQDARACRRRRSAASAARRPRGGPRSPPPCVGAWRPPGSRTPTPAPPPRDRSSRGLRCPTVMSRSSRASSGCQVRSRWSSSSSRQLSRDGQDHQQHVLGDGPAEDAAGVGDDQATLAAAWGVRTRSTPAVAECTQRRLGQRASRRSKTGAGSGPRRRTSTSSSAASARPSSETVTMRAARRGRFPDEVQVGRPVARRQDRRQRDSGRDAVRSASRVR